MYGHATPPLSPLGMVMYMYFREYHRRRLAAGKSVLDRAERSRFAGNPHFIKSARYIARRLSDHRF